MPTVQNATPYRHRKRIPRDLCLTRMRINAREEKRKHGITCHTSSPLEKRRAEGAGWMCLEEAHFYAATSMPTVQSATPYRHRKRIPRDLCLTRMRINAREEKRKHGITCHTSSPLEKRRAEGAGWMCLEEAHFYAATTMPTVQSATPYRHRKRSRGLFASLICE